MTPSVRRRVPVRFRVVRDTLVIDLGMVHRVLSSAPCGGGLIRARSVVNHQVADHAAGRRRASGDSAGRPVEWSDPARYLKRVARDVGARNPSVGLMTAVPVRRVVVAREARDGLWVECFCTVGVTNAVRAGEPAIHAEAGRRCGPAGTINIVLVTNAILSIPAMVGVVQVATESKTAALIARAVRSRTGLRRATGTGTDAVVVACRLRNGPRRQYAGTHTAIGSMIARVVDRCIHQGLMRAGKPNARRGA